MVDEKEPTTGTGANSNKKKHVVHILYSDIYHHHQHIASTLHNVGNDCTFDKYLLNWIEPESRKTSQQPAKLESESESAHFQSKYVIRILMRALCKTKLHFIHKVKKAE